MSWLSSTSCCFVSCFCFCCCCCCFLGILRHKAVKAVSHVEEVLLCSAGKLRELLWDV